MPNALEELFKIAEEFQADIVHAEKWLQNRDGEEINFNTAMVISSGTERSFVDKITVDNNDLAERMIRYSQGYYFWHIWNNLYRREFLIENNLKFSDVMYGGDAIFNFSCICRAKKFVRIPNIFSVHRVLEESVSHISNKDIGKKIHKYLSFFIELLKTIDEYLMSTEFFIENPQFKYMVFNFHLEFYFMIMDDIYSSFKPQDADLFIKKEFQARDSSTLSTFLFHTVNNFHKIILNQQEQINNLNSLLRNEKLWKQ